MIVKDDTVTTSDGRGVIVTRHNTDKCLPRRALPTGTVTCTRKTSCLRRSLIVAGSSRLIILRSRCLSHIASITSHFPSQTHGSNHCCTVSFALSRVGSLGFARNFSVRGNGGIRACPKHFPVNGSSFQIRAFRRRVRFIRKLGRSAKGGVNVCPRVGTP